MNLNISGDQDKMSAPARQALQIYDATDQATTPHDIVSEDCVTNIMKAVVERDETQKYF
jgi:nitrogen regulatory protein PII-like uncharacterized protein